MKINQPELCHIIICLAILISVAGCNGQVTLTAQPTDPPEPTPTLTVTRVATQTVQIPPSSTPTAIPQAVPTKEPAVNCQQPAVKLVDLPIEVYRWSDDGQYIYYRIGTSIDGKWYSIRIYDLSVQPIAPTILEPGASEYELMKKAAIDVGNEFGIFLNNFQYFIPPSRSLIVYMELAYDETGAYYKAYLKHKGKSEIFYLGDIRGGIGAGYWTENGGQLVILLGSMYKMGIKDAYAYLIDINSRGLKIIVPTEEEFRNFTSPGISPDGRWIMYYKKGGLRLWNWEISETRTTPFQRIESFKWKDSATILVVGYLTSPGSLRLYAYNIITNSLEFDYSQKINVSYLSGAYISPASEDIAYNDADDKKLYLLKCVYHSASNR